MIMIKVTVIITIENIYDNNYDNDHYHHYYRQYNHAIIITVISIFSSPSSYYYYRFHYHHHHHYNHNHHPYHHQHNYAHHYIALTAPALPTKLIISRHTLTPRRAWGRLACNAFIGDTINSWFVWDNKSWAYHDHHSLWSDWEWFSTLFAKPVIVRSW